MIKFKEGDRVVIKQGVRTGYRRLPQETVGLITAVSYDIGIVTWGDDIIDSRVYGFDELEYAIELKHPTIKPIKHNPNTNGNK